MQGDYLLNNSRVVVDCIRLPVYSQAAKRLVSIDLHLQVPASSVSLAIKYGVEFNSLSPSGDLHLCKPKSALEALVKICAAPMRLYR